MRLQFLRFPPVLPPEAEDRWINSSIGLQEAAEGLMKGLHPPHRTCPHPADLCPPPPPPPDLLMRRAQQQIHLPHTSLRERWRLAAPNTHPGQPRSANTHQKHTTRTAAVAMVTVRNCQELQMERIVLEYEGKSPGGDGKKTTTTTLS